MEESAEQFVERATRDAEDAHIRGRNAVTLPAAFWSTLTPAQALALLRAAPRVAGPRRPCGYGLGLSRMKVWDDDQGLRVGYRESLDGSTAFFVHVIHDESELEAWDREDAKARAAGWLLVDE